MGEYVTDIVWGVLVVVAVFVVLGVVIVAVVNASKLFETEELNDEKQAAKKVVPRQDIGIYGLIVGGAMQPTASGSRSEGIEDTKAYDDWIKDPKGYAEWCRGQMRAGE